MTAGGTRCSELVGLMTCTSLGQVVSTAIIITPLILSTPMKTGSAPTGLSVDQLRRAHEREFSLASSKRMFCFDDQELPLGAIRVSTFLANPSTSTLGHAFAPLRFTAMHALCTAVQHGN